MINALRFWIIKKRAAILPEGTLRSRFALGVFWSLVGTIISQGLSLTASIVVARFLGKVGFGELGIINSTVGMFGVFAGLGLGITATKYVAELRDKNPQRAGKILGLSQMVAVFSGGIVSLVLFIFAPVLAAKTLNAPHLTNELRLGCGLLFLNALTGAQTGALSGFEAFKTIAQVNFVRGLLNFPIMIMGVWLFGLRGVIGGMVVVAAAGWLFNYLALCKKTKEASIPITYRGIKSECQILWSFSLPAVLSSALVGPATWIAYAILVNQPNGYAEMGIFNAANQWKTFIAFIPSVMSQVTLPMLSTLHGKNDFSSYRKVLWSNLGVISGITFVFATCVALTSPWIMAAYGKGFSEGWSTLVILSLAAVLSASTGVIGQAIASSGSMWWGFRLNAIWALILLLTAYYWTSWGAIGLAGAFLAAYGIHLITVSIYTYTFMRRMESSYVDR